VTSRDREGSVGRGEYDEDSVGKKYAWEIFITDQQGGHKKMGGRSTSTAVTTTRDCGSDRTPQDGKSP